MDTAPVCGYALPSTLWGRAPAREPLQMTRTRLLPGLFLAALLVGAQGAVVLHTLEHDAGVPVGKVCGTCVTATQLAAGGVDMPAGETLEPARLSLVPTAHRGFESVHTATVRQRGPPSYH